MASITPWACGLGADSGIRTNYFPDHGTGGDEDAEQQRMIDEEYDGMAEDDGRTPLDKTIDRIGMGVS